MSVDTVKVAGRRTLHFANYDDILAEVERLDQGKVRALGNWSPGQVLKHLTGPMFWSLDGAPLQGPWYIRLFGWFMKNRFVRMPMAPGFKLPEDFAMQLVPGATTWEDGLQAVRTALARMKAEPQRHPSPFLGALTLEQWEQLHCRHCELHLSFLLPDPA